MIMKANKQIGFIYKDNESIDKILKDGEVVFEKGFLREKTSTTLPITFGGVGKDLKDYRVYGNTVQNGTPTPDTPIDMISCGDKTKNLFDKENYNYITAYLNASNIITNSEGATIFYIKCEPNTTYTVSKTKLFTNDRFCLFDTANIPQINDSALSYVGTKSGENISTSLTITTSNNANYLCAFVQASPSRPSATRNDLAETIQIEKNSTATSYEPYGYKIPVNVRSDNLFDKSNTTNGYYIDSNGDLTSHNSFAYSDYIQIKENTVYSYSGSTGLANYARKCAWYDSSKNLIRVDNFGNSGQLTSPNNAKYFRTSVRIIASGTQDTDIGTYLLVEGSTTPSKYIPYYNETTNIYLDEPLRKIDEYSDYIDFINGKVVRNITEFILDGARTTNLYFNSASQNTSRIQYTSNPRGGSNDTNIFCNQLLGKLNYNPDIEGVYVNNASIVLRINKDKIGKSITTANEYFSVNPLILNYILATPTEESITLPNVSTVEGNNTLNIETEITPSQVYIKYKSSE